MQDKNDYFYPVSMAYLLMKSSLHLFFSFLDVVVQMSGKGWVTVRNARGAKFRVRTNECVDLRTASSSSESRSSIGDMSSANSTTNGSSGINEEMITPSISISKGQQDFLKCFDGEREVAAAAKPSSSSMSPRGAAAVEIVGLDGTVEQLCPSQVDAAKYLEVRGIVSMRVNRG